MTGIIYVACPYSHSNPLVREERFERVSEFCAELSRAGLIVFSPISHTHPIAKYGLPTDWAFWERFERAYMEVCRWMIVYAMDGWEVSTGVQSEIAIMRELNRPIVYVDKAATAIELLGLLEERAT